MPMLADEAVQLGIADLIFEENWDNYHEQLKEYCLQLEQTVDVEEYCAIKSQQLAKDTASKSLAQYRQEELTIMKKAFFDPNSSYHEKRRAFVYKFKTPVEREPINKLVANKA